LPWKAVTVSDVRLALCHSIRSGGLSVGDAARRFGVSRKTAHKWLKVFDHAPDEASAAALDDRSRRPHRSPRRTDHAVEQRAIELRDRHRWGARKIHFVLRRQLDEPPPQQQPSSSPASSSPASSPAIPSIRTISSILARNGRITPAAPPPPPLQRFERAEPNELWQVDFKGPLEVQRIKLMPFTVLDDHSRYLLAFEPRTDLTMATAWGVLWNVFGEVGLPRQILCDNAFSCRRDDRPVGLSWFDARLVRLDIQPSHGRPYHPQTQGKVEALHRSAERELFDFDARKDCQLHFRQDCVRYRHCYNTQRPHQAIGDVPPILRWRPSPRPRPPRLPPVEYPAGSTLRCVCDRGRINFKTYRILCGHGLAGERVRVEERDREIAVFYCDRQIRCLSHDQLKRGIIL
jgi:transposase InsO family protein